MKILHVNHLLDSVTGGGTAERTWQISRFLAKAGVECTVLTLDIGITAERIAGLGNVQVVALPCLNKRFFVPKASFAEVAGLVAKADVIHLSGHWTLLNALVYRACRKLGKSYVFCPAGALKPFGRSLVLKYFYDVWMGRRLARSAAACVAITYDERADFAACGVIEEQVRVIPNGIDPEQYELSDPVEAEDKFRQESGLGSAPYVLFLGRLNEIKGPDLLLDAFGRIANRCVKTHLVLAGPDGGMLQQLRAKSEAEGIAARVHFTGYLGGRSKVAALRGASLLAIPSRREAMSIVVLEAGVCGRPVLFTDACGLEEIFRAGAGTMVAVSVEAIADGLLATLTDEPSMHRSATRLHALVHERFLWRIQAERYKGLCEQLLANGASLRNSA
jgi:glycosyltransferase involved in cell wall biosynthesis